MGADDASESCASRLGSDARPDSSLWDGRTNFCTLAVVAAAGDTVAEEEAADDILVAVVAADDTVAAVVAAVCSNHLDKPVLT